MPTAVLGGIVPFEPLDDSSGFGGRKGFVKRGRGVGVEVVLHEDDFFGLREVGVGHLFEDAGVIDGGAPLGDLDMPPAFEWREQHEQVGRAVAPVFVVKARRPARTHRRRHARFGDKLPAGLVETNQRAGRVVRAPVDLQHIFHRRHEGGIGLGRDDPLPF